MNNETVLSVQSFVEQNPAFTRAALVALHLDGAFIRADGSGDSLSTLKPENISVIKNGEEMTFRALAAFVQEITAVQLSHIFMHYKQDTQNL